MRRLFTSGVKKLILSIVILVFISSVFYHTLEGWSWIDAMYFTVLTITTIGHAVLFPSSVLSKIFTSALAIVGIAMMLTLFGIISSHYVHLTMEEEKRK